MRFEDFFGLGPKKLSPSCAPPKSRKSPFAREKLSAAAPVVASAVLTAAFFFPAARAKGRGLFSGGRAIRAFGPRVPGLRRRRPRLGLLLRCLFSLGNDGKIEPAAIDINVGNFDADTVTQPVSSARAAGDEAECGFVEIVVVVAVEGRNVDQSVRRNLDALTKKSEPLDARDRGGHFEADFVLEIGQQFDFDQFTLGLFGFSLGG